MAISAIPLAHAGPPLLRVVTPQGLNEYSRAQDEAAARAARPAADQEAVLTDLARYIRTEWESAKNHRGSASGWSDRLLSAQRVFNGEYDPAKLAEIRKFGGSDVYARIVALKCRGASALLREVYLGTDKPWGLDPTPDPELPDAVGDAIAQLVGIEAQQAQAAGQPLDLNSIRDRTRALTEAALHANKKKAKIQAKAAEDKLDDLLIEGGFYEALTEFLTDLPLFPFACIKGPVVRMVPDVIWREGKAVTEQRARMFWNRVSPFDIWWTSGASSIRSASVFERTRLTRADINDLLDLPGYNRDNLERVLDDYSKGLRDWMDNTDSQRAEGENRENPNTNRSGFLDCLEFNGNVQGRMLHEYGFTTSEVPDPLRDYFVQAWLIGRYVIKVQLSPNPRKRHPYYITSFEKVPGTPVGNALPDMLSDVQDVCNATLRSLVNNMSIASGPQVVVDESALSPLENGDEIFPWKRWRVQRDPMATNNSGQQPIYFFSPNSNAQELLTVYKEFTSIADELSAIPRYITGSDKLGGAGRTASGLAMLMGNASKVLQMVANNIDHDVIKPLLQWLYDMVMLTDQSGSFRGDESINVRGVEVAVQRETARQRQIELLQATQNPIDLQIMGPEGRAKLLRSVCDTVGIQDEIIPTDEELRMKMAPPPAPGMPPGMMPPPAGPNGPPSLIGPGGSPPAPANTDLGVQDGVAMRGMLGNG